MTEAEGLIEVTGIPVQLVGVVTLLAVEALFPISGTYTSSNRSIVQKIISVRCTCMI